MIGNRSTSTWKADPDRDRHEHPGLCPPRGAAEACASGPAADRPGGRQDPMGAAGLRPRRVPAHHHPPQALSSPVLGRRSLHGSVADPGRAEPLRAVSRPSLPRAAARGHPGIESRREPRLRRPDRSSLPRSGRWRSPHRGSGLRPLPRLSCRTARIGQPPLILRHRGQRAVRLEVPDGAEAALLCRIDHGSGRCQFSGPEIGGEREGATHHLGEHAAGPGAQGHMDADLVGAAGHPGAAPT
jgi:hypothetical protein